MRRVHSAALLAGVRYNSGGPAVGGKTPSVVAASLTNPLATTYHQTELPTNIGSGPMVINTHPDSGIGVPSADGRKPSRYEGKAREPLVRLDRSWGMIGLREESSIMSDGQILGFVKTDKEKGKPDGPLPCDTTRDTGAAKEASRNMEMGSAPFALKNPPKPRPGGGGGGGSGPRAAPSSPFAAMGGGAGGVMPQQTGIKRPLFAGAAPQTGGSSAGPSSAAVRPKMDASAAYAGLKGMRTPPMSDAQTVQSLNSNKVSIDVPKITRGPAPEPTPIRRNNATAAASSHGHGHGDGGTCTHDHGHSHGGKACTHDHGHSHSHSGPQRTEQDEREARDYYKNVPTDLPDKDEVWARIQKQKGGFTADPDDPNRPTGGLDPSEVDFIKMEEDIKENDLFHYRVGELAFVDEAMRRDFYAMHLLSMNLNKARWTMMEVHAEKGQKTTGAGMKLMYWKDSTNQVIEQRNMPTGQFVDSHPVLRQFAHCVRRHKLTKTFLRGMVDAKLKVIHQPGNVKQLFEVFDKSYGYFYNSLLEVMGIKDDAAEHVMLHIGRAVGLTQHSVMFWKKYARLGFTMIPADICADNHINLSLLKNLHLAEKDRYVRRALYDVMSIVKTEMLHAQDIIGTCPVEAWPLIMDAFYPNYYLGFLQRNNFNVSAMWADENIENAGFSWYKYKKVAQWEKKHDLGLLISESAPVPFIGFSPFQRESKYKRSSEMMGPSGTKHTNMSAEEAESSRSRI